MFFLNVVISYPQGGNKAPFKPEFLGEEDYGFRNGPKFPENLLNEAGKWLRTRNSVRFLFE